MGRIDVKLLESYSLQGQHDPVQGIITGIRVLGLTSKNRRRYTAEAAKKAVPLLESATVYVDHPADKPASPQAKSPRSIRDRFGRLKNVRQGPDGGTVADLHYRPKHWFGPQFADLVDNDPLGIGLSINAAGMGYIDSTTGETVVDEITKVHSVDLVDDPATVLGIWEQTEMEPLTTPAPDAGMMGGGDWRAQCGELLKSLATDATLDKAQMRAKVMAVLKILDEPDTATETAEPITDDELMEQTKALPLPIGRKLVQRLQKAFSVERRTQAVKAGLPEMVLTEQFLGDLAAAPAAKVDLLIKDRLSVYQAARGPVSVGSGPAAGASTPAKQSTAVDIATLSKQMFP